MKKLLVSVFLAMFLISLVFAANNNSGNSQNLVTQINSDSSKNNSEDKGVENKQNTSNKGNDSELQISEQAKNAKGVLSEYKARVVKRKQNQLKANTEAGNCPSDCECTGAVTKCKYHNNRTMTIKAGKSGNTIVQVKGQNMSTQVNLYKAEGKIYGEFQGDKTKEIGILPDQAREKIKEKIQQKNCSCNIELNQTGAYQIKAQKKARLFGFIPIKEEVEIDMDSYTGEILKQKNPWWGFLAKDIKEE